MNIIKKGMPEVGIDGAVGYGVWSLPSDKLCGAFRKERCAAYDHPHVTVTGCGHRPRSTRKESQGARAPPN